MYEASDIHNTIFNPAFNDCFNCRLKFFSGSTQVVDTGCVCDKAIIGGKLGVFSFSQANVIWSNIRYSCVAGKEIFNCLLVQKIDASCLSYRKPMYISKSFRKNFKKITVIDCDCSNTL